jgi:transcriptional regulator with XRE-family HTH domain
VREKYFWDFDLESIILLMPIFADVILGSMIIMDRADCLRAFGIRLERTRTAAKMTQKELAVACGYTGGEGVISKIEKGESNPPLYKIEIIAKALKTIPSALAFEDTASISSQNERQLLTMFWGLNIDGQEKALDYTKDLYGLEKYREK